MHREKSPTVHYCNLVTVAPSPPKPAKKPTVRVAAIQFDGIKFVGVVDVHADISVIPQEGRIAKMFASKIRPSRSSVAVHHENNVYKAVKSITFSLSSLYAPRSDSVVEQFFILPGLDHVCEQEFILSCTTLCLDMDLGFVPTIYYHDENEMIYGVRKVTSKQYNGIIHTSNNLDFVGLQCDYKSFLLLSQNYPESLFSPLDAQTAIKVAPMEIRTFERGHRRMYVKRFKPELVQQLRSEIKDLLEKGVLEHSDSDWNSIPKLVQKRDGISYRLILNCTALNDITVPMTCRPPNLKEIVDYCERRGCEFYSSLDCRQSTYQMLLASKDRHKTAFQTPFGKFQYKRLPFGTRNTTPYFQSKMNEIFRAGLWDRCIIYVDDILVHGRTRAEHDSNLKWVLGLCAAYNIKLHPAKCVIGKKQVDYCGFTIARHCMPQRTKVDAWLKQKLPQDAVVLQLFLTKLNIYSIFLDEQQKSLDLLRELVRSEKQGDNLGWRPNHIRAYKNILSTLDKLVVGKLVHLPDD